MQWNLMGLTWAVALCMSWQGHCAGLPELTSSMLERASAVHGPEQPLKSVPLEAGGDVVKSNAQQMHLASLAHRQHHPPGSAHATAADPPQPSMWQYCCATLHQQAAALLGLQHMQASHSSQLHSMEPAGRSAAARKLLAQQQLRPPGGEQQYSVLGSLGAVPFLAVVVLMVAGPFRWFKRSKQDSVPGASCTADTSCTQDGSTSMAVDAAVSLLDAEVGRKSPKRCLAEGVEDTCVAVPRQLLAGRYGWELSSTMTTPAVGQIGNQEVRFGVLVGSGSSSQVYRGVWANTDVAVKLIPYDSSALSNPEQHMQELMSLNHPNLVRTFCGVTYTLHGVLAAMPAAGQHSSRGCTDSARQLGQQDAPKFAGCNSAYDQHQDKQQQLFVLTGTPPCMPSQLNSSNVMTSPTSSMGSAMSPVSRSAGGFRASDSGGNTTTSPRVGLLQQQLQDRPGRASASSLSTVDGQAEAWLVQEYCNLGSLNSVALEWQIAGEGDLQMFERLSLLVDAARGLKYLHGRDMVHGDLNAHNVVISRSTDATVRMTAKLTDMGMCAAIKHSSSHHGAKTVRVLSHVAPEVQRHGAAHAGPASDIYSFGVMMWEVFTGQQAYRKLLDAEHLYEAIVIQNLRPKIPEGMPADYQLLMERCWASDPADRPTVDKLVGCLTVMAAERQRRINPSANMPPPATPAAAAAVAARCPWGRLSPLAYSNSCDQATLQMHQQAAQQQLGGSSLWRQGSGGNSILRPSSMGRLPQVVPGAALLQHKSCPAATFQSLLQSGSFLARSSQDSDESESEQAQGYEIDPADAVFAELQEEEEMLQQLRASSQTQSGPGSAPVLHSTQPHQRFTDGLDLTLTGLDDSHTWHI